MSVSCDIGGVLYGLKFEKKKESIQSTQLISITSTYAWLDFTCSKLQFTFVEIWSVRAGIGGSAGGASPFMFHSVKKNIENTTNSIKKWDKLAFKIKKIDHFQNDNHIGIYVHFWVAVSVPGRVPRIVGHEPIHKRAVGYRQRIAMAIRRKRRKNKIDDGRPCFDVGGTGASDARTHQTRHLPSVQHDELHDSVRSTFIQRLRLLLRLSRLRAHCRQHRQVGFSIAIISRFIWYAVLAVLERFELYFSVNWIIWSLYLIHLPIGSIRCCKKHDYCYGATPCRHQVVFSIKEIDFKPMLMTFLSPNRTDLVSHLLCSL